MAGRRKTIRRRIEVGDVEYRWSATGQDGYISLTLKPSNRIGPIIETSFSYGERMESIGLGAHKITDKIVITNRIVRRVIEHAIHDHKYDPIAKGRPLRLFQIEKDIDMSDVIRVSDT